MLPGFYFNQKIKKLLLERDGRISGEMVQSIVADTLKACGLDVIDIGLTTTPTLEMLVHFEKAAGGIIITASHNPKEWNALKLLNSKGEFINAEDGEAILKIAESNDFKFATIDKLGAYIKNDTAIDKHIEAILNYELVDISAIKKKEI